MPADYRVLVTRPSGQAQVLIDSLRERGLEVQHVPMLEIEALNPLPAQDRQHVLDLDGYDHLIFISSNAAHFGLACIDDYWPQYPAEIQCWAVGDSTARVLRRAGLSVRQPERDLSTEGLLAMPGLNEVQGQKILIVKGQGGRETLARSLSERGAVVHNLSCYRRARPAVDGQTWRAQLDREPLHLILVSSGEGLSNLTQLLNPRENTNLAGTALIVPSERVEEQARELGWCNVRRAVNASDASMLAAAEVCVAQAKGKSIGGDQRP